jgi:glycosyltransferase involved in cell wall biosynthesis
LKTIGLSMIVKNEAHVIRRCLGSVLRLVDYFLIVDTGSEDGTQQVVRDFLLEHHAGGVVIGEPWRNFAYNRTFALEKLRNLADVDYALIIDADDQLMMEDEFDPALFKSQLCSDWYDIQIRDGDAQFFRAQLCNNKRPFYFKGVLHEYLVAPSEGCSHATARGFYIESGRVGARSRDPRKYEEDAEVIEGALLTETDPALIARYKFYLAQSYRDAGQPEKALTLYLERAQLGGWNEEIFQSLYNAGQLKESLGYPEDEIIGAYLRAYEHSPGRVESLHELVRYCYTNGKPALGYLIGKQAIKIPMPLRGLFVQAWIYEYGMLDEFASAAYWSGHYRDCLEACLRLLADAKIPADQRARIRTNANCAREKLANSPQPLVARPADPSLKSSLPQTL